jgi:prevent-host-death family protein
MSHASARAQWKELRVRLSLKDDVNSLSYFKSNFSKVLKRVRNKQRPMVITQNGKSAGVFMDIETWENHIRKLNLLRLVNEGEVSLKHEKSYSLEEAERYFSKKYGL